MNYTFQLQYPYVLYIGIPLLLAAMWYRLWFYRPVEYQYSLYALLSSHATGRSYSQYILFFLRTAALGLLVFLLARPQIVDTDSKVHVEGIDIMLVIDFSNSMMLFDDLNDRRSRVEVAKSEAIKFIEKRIDDQIGVVVFGQDAVSRCPLTLDKLLLKKLVLELELGVVNPDGTVLGKAIVTALNRLKNSQAESKIMILLTDGEPTPELDIPMSDALSVAKQLGVKIYTIGIGGEHGGLLADPLFGVRSMGFRMNKHLLQKIAQETGGKAFEAKKPQDLERIYDTIDQLEKTEYETTVYKNYYDVFMPFLLLACGALLLELFLSTFVWFAL